MRALLRLMKPDNFEDISAVGALYRPGPMGVNSHTNYALRKNGQQEITPIHPELEEPLREVLEPTYGLIVYQEQVQKAAQILAGYTLGQADLLRRAMGKKKKEILDKEFVPFHQGCRERGYSDKAIQAVWDVLVPFAGYAFNPYPNPRGCPHGAVIHSRWWGQREWLWPSARRSHVFWRTAIPVIVKPGDYGRQPARIAAAVSKLACDLVHLCGVIEHPGQHIRGQQIQTIADWHGDIDTFQLVDQLKFALSVQPGRAGVDWSTLVDLREHHVCRLHNRMISIQASACRIGDLFAD